MDGSDPRLSESTSPRSVDMVSTAALNCSVRRRLLANASASCALSESISADWSTTVDAMDGVASSKEVHPGAAPWPWPENIAGGALSKFAHPPSSPASEFGNEPTGMFVSASSPSTAPPVSTRRSALPVRSAAIGLSFGSTVSSSEMSRTTPALLPCPLGSEYDPFSAGIFASAPNGSLVPMPSPHPSMPAPLRSWCGWCYRRPSCTGCCGMRR